MLPKLLGPWPYFPDRPDPCRQTRNQRTCPASALTKCVAFSPSQLPCTASPSTSTCSPAKRGNAAGAQTEMICRLGKITIRPIAPALRPAQYGGRIARLPWLLLQLDRCWVRSNVFPPSPRRNHADPIKVRLLIPRWHCQCS